VSLAQSGAPVQTSQGTESKPQLAVPTATLRPCLGWSWTQAAYLCAVLQPRSAHHKAFLGLSSHRMHAEGLSRELKPESGMSKSPLLFLQVF